MTRAKQLIGFLNSTDFDAFLKQDISNKDASMFYLTDLKIPDPAVYLQTQEESILMVYRSLELNRAREESSVDKVKSSNEYTSSEENHSFSSLVGLLRDENVQKLAVTEDFELGLANKLEQEGFEIEVIDNLVMESRKQKSSAEIDKLRRVQTATEDAMKETEKILKKSSVKNGQIYFKEEPLTSERLKSEIEKFLLDRECRNPEGLIVTSGKASSDAHKRESGKIMADEPIIVDIFPQHKSMYFGDMTRTFVKGEASEKLRKMKNAVLEAQEAAFEVLEQGEGTKATQVHNSVCNVLENHGYQTPRNGAETKGFIHSTGHAVGLDLHEPPKVAENEEELKAGMILTIEPGLYDPEIGGVRIEDMILVTEDGYENFNSMHKKMELN
mgnify:CR=1 FL=1